MRGKLRAMDWGTLSVGVLFVAVLAATLVLAVWQSSVAYLPPLIAGGAGVGGAWLGGRAAQRAAETHGRTEHRAWTRDRRERAYAHFLDARDRYVESWIAVERLTDQARTLRGWLEEHADEAIDTRDGDLAGRISGWRTNLVRVEQRLEAEARTVQEARPEFQRALVNVELFATGPVREAARTWAADIEERYNWIFEGGEYWHSQVQEARQAELAKHRDPFLDLVRKELGIDASGQL